MGDRWIWFMLLGLHVLHEATSMSTCKSVDMEQVKKRRIEAIRGQILSKLKLTKAPDVESENMTLPEDIFSIYNSTVETIKEFTEKVDRLTSSHSEKEYYGKEVQKIRMTTDSSDLSKGKDGLLFIFSAVSVRNIVKDATLLHQVELRMYRKKSSNDNKELRMELYRDLGNNSFRYLDSKFFLPGGDNEWLSFDVTQTVREWMNNKEKNEGFKLSLACACEKSDEDDKKLDIEGFSQIRGDLKELTEKSLFTPYLLITYIPEARMENGHSSRTKRALDGEYCQSNPGSNCCVKTLYINFRKDLGWKWIHEPKGYEANYCLGNCPYIWGMDTQYSRVLSLYNQNNPGASISPCCVPDVLDPLPIIYYVGRQAKVEKLSNMVVRSCHCS